MALIFPCPTFQLVMLIITDNVHHINILNGFHMPKYWLTCKSTSSVVFLRWTLPSIYHRTYFNTSKGHLTWFIKKVSRIPTHCGVAYESVCSLLRGHVISVWYKGVSMGGCPTWKSLFHFKLTYRTINTFISFNFL